MEYLQIMVNRIDEFFIQFVQSFQFKIVWVLRLCGVGYRFKAKTNTDIKKKN